MVAVYGPLVFRLARRQGLQQADADDLVQEVFASLSRSVGDWLNRDDRGRFRAWLLRIAKNTAVNFLTRRNHRPLGTGGDEMADWMTQIPSPSSTLSNEFDLEYRREVFLWAAETIRDSVAEPTWQAFWMTHVQGLSIEEASKQLKLSVGNIYVGRCRVMNRLQKLIKQLEVEE